MVGMAGQLVMYGLLATVLVVHAGLAYRLYHRSRDASAISFMGFLLARGALGTTLIFNALLLQVVFPSLGAMQVLLLSTLLVLPFHALEPFFFIQFVFSHLGKPLAWKLKLGYWCAFGGIILYYLSRNLWTLLHLDAGKQVLFVPVTSFIALALTLLTFIYWAVSWPRIPDAERRKWSAILGGVLLAGLILQLAMGGRGLFRLDLPPPTLGTIPTPPLAGHPALLADLDRLITALLLFWCPIPAYWVLRRYLALPKPESESLASADLTGFADRFGLSPREVEVATLVMEGHSNKEICEALFISLDTVKRHITNVYRKTGVRNRVQLSRLPREFNPGN